MKKLRKDEMKKLNGGRLYYCLIYDVTGQTVSQQFLCTGCAGVDLYNPNDRCRQLNNPAAGVIMTY
jgi:hypothetical protein